MNVTIVATLRFLTALVICATVYSCTRMTLSTYENVVKVNAIKICNHLKVVK